MDAIIEEYERALEWCRSGKLLDESWTLTSGDDFRKVLKEMNYELTKDQTDKIRWNPLLNGTASVWRMYDHVSRSQGWSGLWPEVKCKADIKSKHIGPYTEADKYW